jgi:hypothetical protein
MQYCLNKGWTSRRKSTFPGSWPDWAEVNHNALSATATTQHLKTPNAFEPIIQTRFLVPEPGDRNNPRLSSLQATRIIVNGESKSGHRLEGGASETFRSANLSGGRNSRLLLLDFPVWVCNRRSISRAVEVTSGLTRCDLLSASRNVSRDRKPD